MNIVNNGDRLATYMLAGMFCLVCPAMGDRAQAASPINGEADFKQYCASCHADGGNIIKPTKTLSKMDREKNGIKIVKDIIKSHEDSR